MRASVALLGGIVVLFTGWQFLGQAADQSRDAAVTNGTNGSAAAYNMSTGIYEGVGAAAPGMVVWGGVAAVVLISCGLLLRGAHGRGGGR